MRCLLFLILAAPAFADGRDWIVVRPATRATAVPVVASPWILQSDGSYVRTLRRAETATTTFTTPQARAETVTVEPLTTFHNGVWWSWDGARWNQLTAPVYTVPTYYAVPTRRGYRYEATGDICISGT